MIIKANRDLNYPIKNDEDSNAILFNCPNCGFHSKVINIYYLKGCEDQMNIQLVNMTPEEWSIKYAIKKDLNGDGEAIEENICGKCGTAGHLEQVPKHHLKSMGII